MDCESEISQNYSELLKQYNQLQRDSEILKQELHNSNRQLKLNETLLNDYKTEVESIQNEKKLEETEWQSKINNLEEKVISLKATYTAKINEISFELEKEQQKCYELQKELECSEKEHPPVSPADDRSVNFDEVIQLREENNLLKEHIGEAGHNLQLERQRAEEIIKQYKEEVEQLQEVLQIKRDELSEKNVLIEELNDEALDLNKQLESFKNKPLVEGSKGNSLFAEVNDRRVKLQEQINTMKSEFIKLKQDKSINDALIIRLRREKAESLELWKKDIEEIAENKQMVSDSLQSHTKCIEEIIAEQKKILGQYEMSNNIKENRQAYQFYQEIIKTKDENIKKLSDDLHKKSFNFCLMTRSLAEAKQEIRKLRIKQLEQQAEIEKLENIQHNSIVTDKNEIIDYQLDQHEIETPVLDSKWVTLRSCLKKEVTSEVVLESTVAGIKLTNSDAIRNRHINMFKSELNRNRGNMELNTTHSFKTDDIYTNNNNNVRKAEKYETNLEEPINIRKEVTFNDSNLNDTSINMSTSRAGRVPARVFVAKKRNLKSN